MPSRMSVRARLRRPVQRFRRGGRGALLWTLRLTTASVAAYVVAQLLLPSDKPLLAPLTALLVIQATPIGLLSSGLDRIVSVVVGVLLAVGVAEIVPISWWSLAIVIALSLLAGQALRLRANLIEVAISGMLVLGVAQADAAAWTRVSETLVGAGVGVLANLVFPPKTPFSTAAEAIDDLARRLTSLLRRAAHELSEDDLDLGGLGPAAADWLGDARRINHEIPGVGLALERVEEGRKLNVRMVRAPNAAPGLRQGLEALEHTSVALRSLFRGIRDAVQDESWPDDAAGREAVDDLVQVLDALAGVVTAFGHLVRYEATSSDLQAPDRVADVQRALEDIRDVRVLLAHHPLEDNPALAELYLTMGSVVKRVRSELDLEDRARRQDMLRPARRPVRDVIDPRVSRRRPRR